MEELAGGELGRRDEGQAPEGSPGADEIGGVCAMKTRDGEHSRSFCEVGRLADMRRENNTGTIRQEQESMDEGGM